MDRSAANQMGNNKGLMPRDTLLEPVADSQEEGDREMTHRSNVEVSPEVAGGYLAKERHI